MALSNSNTAFYENIMSARKEVSPAQAGKAPVLLTIQSVKYSHYSKNLDGIVDIYGTNASKSTVLDSSWYKETEDKAYALEAAGQKEEARKLFEELMSKSNLSFNVINNAGTAYQFVKGEMINAPIILVTVKDDAGVERQSVAVGKAYPVQAQAAGQSRSFRRSSAIDIAVPDQATAAPVESALAGQPTA
jgi:hypothetical protein